MRHSEDAIVEVGVHPLAPAYCLNDVAGAPGKLLIRKSSGDAANVDPQHCHTTAAAAVKTSFMFRRAVEPGWLQVPAIEVCNDRVGEGDAVLVLLPCWPKVKCHSTHHTLISNSLMIACQPLPRHTRYEHTHASNVHTS
jgi:hypothetical protein